MFRAVSFWGRNNRFEYYQRKDYIYFYACRVLRAATSNFFMTKIDRETPKSISRS